MRKKGKLFLALLITGLLLGLTACGGNQEESSDPAGTESGVPGAEDPTQESSTEPPAPVYEFHLRNGENRFIKDQSFDGKVIVDGDGATITFTGCSFSDNILNNAAEYTRVYISEDCQLAAGVIGEIHSGVREATLDYALPKFITSVPLTVVSEDLGAVYGKLGVPITFNEKSYTEADMQLLSVNGVLFPMGEGYTAADGFPYEATDGYLVSHWWENGEEVFFLKAECTVDSKKAPVLYTLDPDADGPVSDMVFPGPVYVDGSSGSLRFENCEFKNTLTVLATGNAAPEEADNCSHLSFQNCKLNQGLEVRGNGLEMSLTDCELLADAVNMASEFTRVKLLDGCSFAEGVKAVVKSGLREADGNYPLPKIYLSTPLEAVCEDLGGIFLCGEFEGSFNGKTYSPKDINYYTLNGQEQEYDGEMPLLYGYLICHWWENGEEKIMVSANNEYHYSLKDLPADDPRRAAFTDYPNLGIFADPRDINVTFGHINVRSTPEVSETNIVGELLPFNAVNILGEEGDFYKVDSGSLKGVYVSKSYILTGKDAEWFVLDHLVEKVKVRDPEGVNLRSTPSAANLENRIMILLKGSEYLFSGTVQGEDGHEWVKLCYGTGDLGNGQSGPLYGYVRRDSVVIEYAMQTANPLPH